MKQRKDEIEKLSYTGLEKQCDGTIVNDFRHGKAR